MDILVVKKLGAEMGIQNKEDAPIPESISGNSENVSETLPSSTEDTTVAVKEKTVSGIDKENPITPKTFSHTVPNTSSYKTTTLDLYTTLIAYINMQINGALNNSDNYVLAELGNVSASTCKLVEEFLKTRNYRYEILHHKEFSPKGLIQSSMIVYIKLGENIC